MCVPVDMCNVFEIIIVEKFSTEAHNDGSCSHHRFPRTLNFIGALKIARDLENNGR